jgi:hypothetical protein
MLRALAGQSESNWKEATSAAERAITSRIKLWDGILAHLRNTEQATNSERPTSNGARRDDGCEGTNLLRGGGPRVTIG